MIDNLEKKLSGEIPVNRLELIEIVNSWGRSESQETNDNIRINQFKPHGCYPLENLDVSQIKDLSFIFRYSYYNGDLSKWNVSNCIKMDCMFGRNIFNNDSLKNWNVSNVKRMNYMFYKSNFDGDISNWNISNVKEMLSIFEWSTFKGDISKWKFNENIDCDEIFRWSTNFIDKYNDGKEIPSDTKNFLKWFEKNREKMQEINISKQDILDFFSFDSNLQKEIEL